MPLTCLLVNTADHTPELRHSLRFPHSTIMFLPSIHWSLQ